MDWLRHARRLADHVSDPQSGWHALVATTPRHVFVPRWWDYQRNLHDGPSDPSTWMRVAYSDESLITSISGLHADQAQPGQRPSGSLRSTSSSTLPSLVLRMYRHARLHPGAAIADVGTGSGYGAALLARRLGDEHVTSIDVDPQLTQAASERLSAIGLHPSVVTGDATGPLPGTFDRIVAMVGMPHIPASWMAALRPGGRLVTTLGNTMIIITATKNPDGTACGRVEWDCAGFMPVRHEMDYHTQDDRFEAIEHADGEHASHGRYPVLHLAECWELQSFLEVTCPGIEHYYTEDEEGTRTAWMVHPDGSWARATARGTEPPLVHQSGPRRLWEIFDGIRDYWLAHGQLPLYGAHVDIAPDGTLNLARADWQTTIP